MLQTLTSMLNEDVFNIHTSDITKTPDYNIDLNFDLIIRSLHLARAKFYFSRHAWRVHRDPADFS